MKLVVFGASGRTGRALVQQALQRGHDVTAFARRADRLSDLPGGARVVEGDVYDAVTVRRAVAGSEAVLMALGHTKTSAPDVLETAARHVIVAMEAAGVRRLVTVMGAGVQLPGEQRGLGGRFMVGLMRLFARKLLHDAQIHVDLVANSGLDWTVVRPPRLTNGPHTGRYRSGNLRLGPFHKISRADVADFMLRLVEEGTYIGEAPNVTAARG